MQNFLFEDDQPGEQRDPESFLRQLSPAMQEYIRIAYEHGIGDAVCEIYLTALHHNLTFSPYTDSDGMPVLGIVPQGAKATLILLRVRLKPRDGRIQIYRQTDAFCSAYEVTEQEAAEILGGSGWYESRPHHIGEFVTRLDELFELIEARQGKQLTLFPMFVDEEDSGQIAPIQDESQGRSRAYVEGAKLDVIQTRYERNPAARSACIKHHGLACVVCGFNFGSVYGDIGKGFIHVHHLTPLSVQSKEHEVDPVEDMRPVCPNCHAMLHRTDPPCTVEELQTRFREK